MSSNTRDDPTSVTLNLERMDDAARPTPTESGLPQGVRLVDEPQWWSMSAAGAGWVTIVATAFCWFSRRPLWHTDLWGHLAYGRFIWNNGAPPEFEPLMPLASGTPIVDTAWLSQLLGYAVHELLGVPGLQLLYGLLVTGCLALMLMLVYRPTRNGWYSLAGGGLFLWMSWQQLQIIRPQLAGLICFLALLLVLTGRRRAWLHRVCVPALFLLWANCHGSFVIGLATLGCFCAGRAAESWWRAGRLHAALADAEVREMLLLTVLASAGVLINPYGAGIYREVVTFSANPNLANLVEWKPLTLQMHQGRAAGIVCLMLLAMACLPPRRVAFTELLLLVGLGGAMIWASRMIVWWAPVAALVATRRAHAIQIWYFGEPARRAPAVRRAGWSIITLAIGVTAAAATPLIAGRSASASADAERGLSSQTPVLAVAHLNNARSSGQMFNKFEWGDYLLWAGPPDRPVFVASHVHLIPVDVWRDYLRIAGARPGWREALDAHAVQSVLIDPSSKLSGGLQQDDDWSVDYQDNRSIIFVRAERE